MQDGHNIFLYHPSNAWSVHSSALRIALPSARLASAFALYAKSYQSDSGSGSPHCLRSSADRASGSESGRAGSSPADAAVRLYTPRTWPKWDSAGLAVVRAGSHGSQELNSRAPVRWKFFVLRVTSVRSCTIAVTAMSVSLSGSGSGACSGRDRRRLVDDQNTSSDHRPDVLVEPQSKRARASGIAALLASDAALQLQHGDDAEHEVSDRLATQPARQGR